ncbi:MAG: hypothetical protein M9890_11635 [Thermomicrobiales bacterium]|nr:hypothetical protein [Thermomicrobiales bacterium]
MAEPTDANSTVVVDQGRSMDPLPVLLLAQARIDEPDDDIDRQIDQADDDCKCDDSRLRNWASLRINQ